MGHFHLGFAKVSLKVSESISTKSGVAPALKMASPVAVKVNGV